MKKILFLIALPLIFALCKKETTTLPASATSITMIYQMTQCADAWQNEPNYFNDKAATLKTYLKKQGITAIDVTVVQDCSNAAVCAACTCAGCDLATVKVNANDVAVMEKLKFVKK